MTTAQQWLTLANTRQLKTDRWTTLDHGGYLRVAKVDDHTLHVFGYGLVRHPQTRQAIRHLLSLIPPTTTDKD